ncbi:alpha/beta fold hydrolase [Parafrankia sp. FMc2]|uniref:alpha/beta fold hydrolase n=1 Tax=Parafrankia sp. FMc2 TaxID=3233196 RepID=UPI0034D50CFA
MADVLTHVTAPTRYLEVNGIRYAYRRFGAGGGTPLLFLQHFRGGLDHWDPAVTDGLAANREVILFNNAGVASSSGETPETFAAMADRAAGFVGALGLEQVDVLGLSMGGAVAQELALRNPQLVRRLIIAGFRPRAGEVEGTAPDMIDVATRHEVPTLEDFLYLFFEPSETSQAAGRAFWERRHARTVDVDPPTSRQTMLAQLAAAGEWAEPHGERYSELARITAPTLVVNGRRDIMIPTVNSYVLAQHIPGAQLVIYPDSGHGSIFQYPELFVSQAARFLDAERPFG